jgi:alpha-ribazole phosphatase
VPIYLMRHPKLLGTAGLCYGRFEPELDPTSLQASLNRAFALPPMPVISSPSARCMALAEPLAQAWRQEVQIESGLQELHFGAWEGRRWQDLPRVDTEAWCEDILHRAPPEGESYQQLWQRVQAVRLPESALVIAHQGSLRALLGLRRGLSPWAALGLQFGYGQPTESA